jgi:hypothetical protein
MKRVLFVLFFIAFCGAKAQTKGDGSYKDLVLEGNYLLLEENYTQALQNYLLAYAMDSSSALLNYNMGICYLNTLNQKFKAEEFLARAVKRVDKNCAIDNPLEKSAPPLAHFYYGQALHLNYKFDDELKQYE